MKIYKIKITEIAKIEIQNISDFIYKNSFSEKVADKVYNEIYSKIYWLSILPEINEKYNIYYRVMTINKKYRVFYKINYEKQEVIVNYVFSSSQNYEFSIY